MFRSRGRDIGRAAGQFQVHGGRRPDSPGRRRRRPSLERLESRTLLSTYYVRNTNDSGPGSLRQAILDANGDAASDNIFFDIPASTSPLLSVPVPGFNPVTQDWTITLQSPLPPITSPVWIDAYTQAATGVPFRYPSAISSSSQSVSITGGPTGGTFTLTTAAPLPVGTATIRWDATAADVQAALGAIIGISNLSVSGGPGPSSPFTISFQNQYAGQAIPDLVANASGLTGGTSLGILVQSTVAGGTATQDPVYVYSKPSTLAARTGNDARMRVILDGSNLTGATGIVLAASHSNLRGLIISGFDVGVFEPAVDGSGQPITGNLIQGNAIGGSFFYPVDSQTGSPLTGAAAVGYRFGTGNLLQGVILAGTNTTIGGVNPQEANIICGNGAEGILIQPGATGNQVLGNQIGMAGPSDTGLYAQDGNRGDGIRVVSTGSASDPLSIVYTSGGSFSGNVVSGNFGSGIHLIGVGAIRNLIQNNLIGVAPGGGYLFGTGNPGNQGDGVYLEDAGQNLIGGGTMALGNAISSNYGAGIRISGDSATGNVISRNMIGLTADGAQVLGNAGEGVAIYSPDNTVGPGNVISQNLRGIGIHGPSAQRILVNDNFIGTDGTGTKYGFGNAQEGVRIEDSSDNTIQGNASGSQVISGNRVGVAILGDGSTGNVLVGNLIGSDRTGLTDLSNKDVGVWVGAPLNTIGGSTADHRNLISANHTGIQFDGVAATGNLVQGNFIGTDLTGENPLSNEVLGVLFSGGAGGNTVGGATAALGNKIAFHQQDGVRVLAGTGNSLLSNSIWANRRLGIDLVAPGDPASGVTPNQPGLRIGPNNLQNYPVLVGAVGGGATGLIQGSLTSIPNTPFTIQFFQNQVPDPSGSGQGRMLLGSMTASTGADGTTAFSFLVGSGLPASAWISATATNNATGDTSEFSNVVSALPVSVVFATATQTVDATAGSVLIHVLRQGNPNAVVSVDFATGNGTAIAGQDYMAHSGTLTFQVGEMDKTFHVVLLSNPAQTAGAVTVNLALSQPTGGASLGSVSSSVLTINNNLPPVLQFRSATFRTSSTATSALITVTRGGGNRSSSVQVNYATTSAGSAVDGVDYRSVSGTLTFLANQTTASFSVPILPGSHLAGAVTVELVLSAPTSGGALGNPSTATLTIATASAATPGGPVDTVPPQVIGQNLQVGSNGITTIFLTFDKPMDPGRAQDLASFGYFAVTAGADGRFGTSDDGAIPLASSWYDPFTRTVGVVPSSPIPLNQLARLTINALASPLLRRGLTDTSGNLLSGASNGVAGGPYVTTFGVGTLLNYTEGTSKPVQLNLTGGGLIQLFLSSDGHAQSVTLLGAVPRRSILNIHASGAGGRYVQIPPIKGATGVKVRYRTPPIVVRPNPVPAKRSRFLPSPRLL